MKKKSKRSDNTSEVTQNEWYRESMTEEEKRKARFRRKMATWRLSIFTLLIIAVIAVIGIYIYSLTQNTHKVSTKQWLICRLNNGSDLIIDAIDYTIDGEAIIIRSKENDYSYIIPMSSIGYIFTEERTEPETYLPSVASETMVYEDEEDMIDEESLEYEG